MFDDVVLEAFLKMQDQLFDEPVAETLEEADAFLEDCMAVVVSSKKEVIEYFEEAGADFDEGTVFEASEVFAIGDGRYLIVEG